MAEDASGEELTPEENRRHRQALARMMVETPFIASLGLHFERYEPDDVLMRLPFREDLTNDGVAYHGGVIASVLDTTGASAAWSNHDFARGVRASTVSMTVQYVGATRGTDLLCEGRTVRRARELIFTEISATDPDGRIVAHALQTYRITR